MFATSIQELGIGVADATDNYTYLIAGGGPLATEVTIGASAANGATDLYTYTGITWLDMANPNAATTRAGICQSATPQTNAPACAPGDDSFI